MNRLFANSTHLLKRASHLVRSPIRLTLAPDQRAYYSVAGGYNADAWPDCGFIAQGTVANVWRVGASCVQAYLNPSNSLQIWRAVTTSHDPETVWYQGAYAPSGATAAHSYQSCEAYIQLGAYHFTVPAALSGLSVSSVLVRFTNGGGVEAYQSAGAKSANNSQLKGKYDFSVWAIPFVLSQALVAPAELSSKPSDSSVDILSATGEIKGIRDLWGFSGTTRDGAVPTLSTPQTGSYTMGNATLSDFAANRSGWIIPYIDAFYKNSTSYGPYYVNSQNGYWGCVAIWGLSLEILME